LARAKRTQSNPANFGDIGRNKMKTIKIMTAKEMKQNAAILRTVNRKIRQGLSRIADHPKLAQTDFEESQEIIAGVIEWLENSAKSK
jgi:O-succinylbenzoate synthase